MHIIHNKKDKKNTHQHTKHKTGSRMGMKTYHDCRPKGVLRMSHMKNDKASLAMFKDKNSKERGRDIKHFQLTTKTLDNTASLPPTPEKTRTRAYCHAVSQIAVGKSW